MSWIELIGTLEAVVFVTVTRWATLVVPTIWSGKVRLELENVNGFAEVEPPTVKVMTLSK